MFMATENICTMLPAWNYHVNYEASISLYWIKWCRKRCAMIDLRSYHKVIWQKRPIHERILDTKRIMAASRRFVHFCHSVRKVASTWDATTYNFTSIWWFDVAMPLSTRFLTVEMPSASAFFGRLAHQLVCRDCYPSVHIFTSWLVAIWSSSSIVVAARTWCVVTIKSRSPTSSVSSS